MSSSTSARRTRFAWTASAMILMIGIPVVSVASSTARNAESSSSLLKGPGAINHPVGVVPSNAVRIPTGWPLDAGGAITCFTCHEQLPTFDGADAPHLREFNDRANGAVDGDFCMKCHVDTGVRSAASMHWQATRLAHVRPGKLLRRRSGSGLDGVSRQCLGCHDGVSAPDAAAGGRTHGGSFAEPGQDHPVGMAYPSAGTLQGSAPLRPAATLPKQVLLPGGHVSCVSCHNLFEGTPNRLSVPIEGSALCFTCHAMD